ncbi:MAG: hypothetical protein AAGE94_20135 [Acidobacteriota bacterium]
MTEPHHDPAQIERFGLLHFVALTGAPGKAWVDAFLDHEAAEAMRACESAVRLVRRHRRRAAEDLLVGVEARRAVIADDSPTYAAVLDRFYLAAVAYLDFLDHRWQVADRGIRLASAAIERSLQLCPLLFPYADHCLELRVQRARIARNRLDWSDVSDHLAECFAIAESRAPLCRWADGSPFAYADMTRYWFDECGVSPDAPGLAIMVDPDLRRRTLVDTLHAFFAPIDMVVPNP